MRVVRVADYKEMSRFCAGIVAQRVQAQPEIVLALPTGGTPLGMYGELVRRVRAGELDLTRVTCFNLDEYVGLPPEHTQSYHAYLRRHLYDQVPFDESRLHVADGNAPDMMAACLAYEAAMEKAGGLELTMLGIGSNGHIAFNEPGCSLASGVRVVRLSERTVLDNARFFADRDAVPCHAITMGVGTIRSSRSLLMLAAGAGKARAVAAALEGPLTSRCPASAMQLHPRVVVVIDEAAASELKVRHPTCAEWEADPYASRFLFS